MSNPVADNDDLEFDRLADGELSPRERQALLSSLDDRADGWRRCALALLEAQTWRREFHAFVQEEAPPQAERVGAPLPWQLPARPERWFSLAAGLLLAFGLGWAYRALEDTQFQPTQLADTSVEDLQLMPAPEQLEPPSRDAVTLVVRDVEGRNRRFQLPLVEVSTGNTVDGVGQMPANLRAGLQDRGWELKRTRRYAPLFFEQGTELVPMVVPVDDTYVMPVSRPVY